MKGNQPNNQIEPDEHYNEHTEHTEDFPPFILQSLNFTQKFIIRQNNN